MHRRLHLALLLSAACVASAQNQVPQNGASQTTSPAPPPTVSTTPSEEKTKPPSARQRSEAEKLYLEGAKALDHEDLTTAQKDFARAVELDPTNERYKAANEIALQHQATGLVQAADKARLTGHTDEAREDLARAFRLDPTNPMLAQHVDDIARDAAPDREARFPEAETLAPPLILAPDTARRSFHVRANTPELLRQVLTAYGVTPTLDSSVKSQNVRFDVDDVDFAEAARLVKLLTNTFFVPLDPKRVLIAQDTKDNRAKFERLAVETVYFPGLTPTEISDMGNVAKTLFDIQQASVSPSTSTLTVRAPSSKLAALNTTLHELLDGQSEIQLDLRLYDIAKTKTQNIGAQLPTQATVFNVPSQLNSVLSGNQSLVQQIISAGLADPNDPAAIAAVLIGSGAVTGSILNQPFALFGGGLTLSGLAVGPATANLALNSSDSRTLDQVTLRALDHEDSTIRSGTRYPIITSTYSNLGGSQLNVSGISTPGLSSTLTNLGLNQSSLASFGQTIPQVQYEDLGLTLKVKPYVQKDQDVTLNLDLKITSLQGTLINSIPVLDNQQYTAIITLHQGESALVVSALSKTQSSAVSGVPGLSNLPGFQSTTNDSTDLDYSNLVILITPHIVRLAHKQDAGRMILLPLHP
jgi:general secretion pathway protein D